MQETINKVLKLVAGFVLAIGALVAWHFFHIDGWLAAMVGLGGLALVGHALDFDFDFF